MRIGIDIDGVLAKTIDNLLLWHNIVYDTNFSLEDIKSYNLGESMGVTPEVMRNRMNSFYEALEFRSVKPIAYAQETIKLLAEDNDLMVVTARPAVLRDQTELWLDRFFEDKFSDVAFGNHFAQNGKEIKKSDLCKQLRLDLLVEDSAEYSIEALEQGAVEVLLFDQPWNNTRKLPTEIQRVYTWREIGGILQHVRS